MQSTIIAGAFPRVRRSQPKTAPKNPPLNSVGAELNESTTACLKTSPLWC